MTYKKCLAKTRLYVCPRTDPMTVPSSHIKLISLPASNSKTVILSIPCPLNCPPEMAKLLVAHVFTLPGITVQVVADKGRQFISQVWETYCTPEVRAMFKFWFSSSDKLIERDSTRLNQQLEPQDHHLLQPGHQQQRQYLSSDLYFLPDHQLPYGGKLVFLFSSLYFFKREKVF